MTLLLSILLSLFPTPAAAQVSPGSPVPDFSLTDLNGQTHTPRQYRGRVLLLFILGHN